MPLSLIVRRVLDLIEIQIDARIEGEGLVGVLGQGQVLELVEGVGGVRNQLAEEDFRMGIKGVNDQVEELIDFGLKFSFRHRKPILMWGRLET